MAGEEHEEQKSENEREKKKAPNLLFVLFQPGQSFSMCEIPKKAGQGQYATSEQQRHHTAQQVGTKCEGDERN